MTHFTHQTAVLGSGPAGTALVAALVEAGIDVAWVAPDVPWHNNYGIWVDELQATSLAGHDVFEATWDSPVVATDVAVHELERPYGRIDNEKLQSAYASSTSTAERYDETVVGVETAGDGFLITAEGGQSISARYVFDATGHKPVAVQRPPSEPGYQTAYGAVFELDGEPLGGADMALMDYRTFDGEWDAAPTFLYAMRLPDGRWFLEETVLVARPPVPIGDLRDRLMQRLDDRGVKVLATSDEERCVIPMGDELPDLRQPILGFGGAASFVHPATGYMVARAMRLAPAVAEAAAAALQRNAPAHELWDAIWPDDLRGTRQFYRFGMETLLRFDTAKTHGFFDAFFRLPDEQWRGYLADTIPPRKVAHTMLTLFGDAGLDLKAELAKSAFGNGQFGRLLKALASV